jgi:hypothetical protein
MMDFHKDTAEVFIPDGAPEAEAFARCTHMAIGCHQDDIEIMAYDGILQTFGRDDQWLCAVTVTNGAGSARTGPYADYTDDEMMAIRREEQKKAAYMGEYGVQVLLDCPSSDVKSEATAEVIADLKQILLAANAKVIYCHNLADKHDTHVATTLRTIQAIRELPVEKRPEKLYGCEVWRDLDWMVDEDKVAFDVAAHPNLAAALLGIFDSQDCGGKRYDLASLGRRVAHATYHASHDVDETTALIFAMDLTPLIQDDSLDIGQYVADHINRFAADVNDRVARFT